MNENNDQPIISDEEMKMPEGFTPQSVSGEKSSMLGIVLVILIVVLLLILVGLYLWGTTLNDDSNLAPVAERPSAESNKEPESNNARADTQALDTVSTSDELSSIEADIESTNMDGLDAESNAIEAELEASAQ